MPTTKDLDYLEVAGLGTFRVSGGSGAVDSVNGKTGAVVLDASDVGALPDGTVIPPTVTEQTVSGWGFTKNTGTYSKPSGGIPASDLASGVIPSVPQMATAADMSDWTQGKTVDAATLKTDFNLALLDLDDLHTNKADKTEIPTAVSELTNDSGYQTAQDVQTAISGVRQLPTVTATDNGKFLRVVSGAWAAAQYAPTTPRVAMTSADSTPTLEPNKLYVFPEMASLTPSLATPTDATIVNEYHFMFTSGATAATLTIPATINQPDGFTVEANHVYEVSILEGCMTAQGWAVS